MEQYRIRQSDVAFEHGRDYGYEREIIRAAEARGYTRIRIDDDVIEGIDENGRRCIIAE